MDCWIVALRGDDNALAEVRAVLGSPAADLGPLGLFVCVTTDLFTAGRLFAQLGMTFGDFAGAVALEGDDGRAARERAVALACAAAHREVLFDRTARARLGTELLFVRPARRPGWRLPFGAVALAPETPRRAECREALAHVPAEVPLVDREDEIAALLGVLNAPGPALVRAPLGWGAGRIITEAAWRAGKTIDRLPQGALEENDKLHRAMEPLQGGDWIVVDPVPAGSATRLAALAESLPPSRQLVLRGDFDTEAPFIPPDRQLSLGPMQAPQVHALVRAMLGPATREQVVRRLAGRAGFVPRRVVETVRAAVQLGELVRSGGAWIPRRRRVLETPGSRTDPIVARLGDLPPLLFRALAVAVAVGDGAREVELLAAMRGILSPPPEQLLGLLEALRLVESRGDRIDLSASVAALVRADDAQATVAALTHSGALERGARAEARRRSGRARDAALSYARAASHALEAGLRAAAVRYAAAALGVVETTDALPGEIAPAIQAVVTVLTPAVVVEPQAPAGAVGARALDPGTLEQAAAHLAERNDEGGAARMRALAELMRGNSQRALRITGSGGGEGSSKAQLVAALAQGAAGEVHRAIRTALLALVLARRARQPGGEAAALALLSTLYRAAHREDEARALAEGARRLQPTAAG